MVISKLVKLHFSPVVLVRERGSQSPKHKAQRLLLFLPKHPFSFLFGTHACQTGIYTIWALWFRALKYIFFFFKTLSSSSERIHHLIHCHHWKSLQASFFSNHFGLTLPVWGPHPVPRVHTLWAAIGRKAVLFQTQLVPMLLVALVFSSRNQASCTWVPQCRDSPPGSQWNCPEFPSIGLRVRKQLPPVCRQPPLR